MGRRGYTRTSNPIRVNFEFWKRIRPLAVPADHCVKMCLKPCVNDITYTLIFVFANRTEKRSTNHCSGKSFEFNPKLGGRILPSAGYVCRCEDLQWSEKQRHRVSNDRFGRHGPHSHTTNGMQMFRENNRVAGYRSHGKSGSVLRSWLQLWFSVPQSLDLGDCSRKLDLFQILLNLVNL